MRYTKESHGDACAYRLEDFPDEWLFDPEHLGEWEEWHAEHERMYREILLLACGSGCVRIGHEGSSIFYYLHRSTRFDGMQLTCWDDVGPVGHTDVTDGRRLAREVMWREVEVEAA